MKPAVKLTWKTERRKVADLVPYEFNPRKISPEQAERLTESIKKFNLVEIPAVNTDGVIIAGHQRLAIMKSIGRGAEVVDVRVPNRRLTEAELKEYNLRSNKNTGEWDFELLAGHFDENILKDVGLVIDDILPPEIPDILEEKTQHIHSFKKVHVLLSFFPDDFLKLHDMLEKIKQVPGVEYEQSAN